MDDFCGIALATSREAFAPYSGENAPATEIDRSETAERSKATLRIVQSSDSAETNATVETLVEVEIKSGAFQIGFEVASLLINSKYENLEAATIARLFKIADELDEPIRSNA